MALLGLSLERLSPPRIEDARAPAGSAEGLAVAADDDLERRRATPGLPLNCLLAVAADAGGLRSRPQMVRRFAMTDYGSTGSGDVARDETGSLIAASKVEGTSVYNRQGESLGSVYDVMIDKRSGKVEYAVMSFGGFLGMGQSYHPLPWQVLSYDEGQGGYVVDLDKDRLQNAPSYGVDETPDWSDREYGRRIDEYYGIPARPGL